MFESTLSVASLKYLNQHLIDGNVVFPAACYLEMAIGLAQEFFGTASRDLIFHEPLILASDRRTLQSMITPDSSGSATIQIFSFEESDELKDHSGTPRHGPDLSDHRTARGCPQPGLMLCGQLFE
jgi:hypothetical protein